MPAAGRIACFYKERVLLADDELAGWPKAKRAARGLRRSLYPHVCAFSLVDVL